MTTAHMIENDGRQWFAVTFDDDDCVEITVTVGLTDDGTYLDADGCPLGDNARDAAARRVIGKLVVETLGAVGELRYAALDVINHNDLGDAKSISARERWDRLRLVRVLLAFETNDERRVWLSNLLKRIDVEG